uniref:Uncharacterized protein n=1 Tax=Nelumbo nucifera TaxID=4432 RepID=A0A822ZUU9_NELNU|nr:TPA_asm: hypothetical protein HUJ06_003898 [Nelumbo nucifera]
MKERQTVASNSSKPPNTRFGNGRYGGRPLGLCSSAWPPLQQKPQAGSACSTVLLPARVVQALNLNFDDMGACPRIHGVFAATENDPVTARSNASLSQQKRGCRPQGSMNHEIRLPQDWTY